MTASQRSSYTKRRKAIWEALHPAPKMSPAFAAVFGQELADAAVLCDENGKPIEVGPQGEGEIQVGEVFPPVIGYGKPPPQTKSFAAETAAVTGESKRSINQHLARAEALGDDLERIQGTSLDKGVELDALKAMPEPARKELIERAVAGEIVTARAPAAEVIKTCTAGAIVHAAEYLHRVAGSGAFILATKKPASRAG